jgi:hypothetical protein
MDTCEWCEDEAEMLWNSRVDGFDKHLCKTCHDLYLDGLMGEFVSRRPNWDNP